jgi:hypothetical protein
VKTLNIRGRQSIGSGLDPGFYTGDIIPQHRKLWHTLERRKAHR